MTGRGLAFLGAGACKRCIACCGVAAAASQRMEPAHQVASDAARKARVEQLAGGLDAAASVSLAPGDDVVVSGLKSAPQHNGKRGTIVEVEGVSSDGGRLHVRLSETEVLAIKPENLARRRPGPGAAWLKSGLVRIDTGGLQGISALPIWDFARSSLGIPAGSWAQSAEEWHVVRAPWQNADVMWTLRARLKRRDGSSCDSETPFVFGDRFGNIDGQMKLEHRSQAPLDLTEGSQILLFPAVEVGWMFSSTGAITLRNTGAVTVTLLGIPLSDDEPHALSPVEQRSWTLRAGETQGFDYMGEWAIAVTARASASIVVTEHATSGGGMGNWLGMNGPRNAEENTRTRTARARARGQTCCSGSGSGSAFASTCAVACACAEPEPDSRALRRDGLALGERNDGECAEGGYCGFCCRPDHQRGQLHQDGRGRRNGSRDCGCCCRSDRQRGQLHQHGRGRRNHSSSFSLEHNGRCACDLRRALCRL